MSPVRRSTALLLALSLSGCSTALHGGPRSALDLTVASPVGDPMAPTVRLDGLEVPDGATFDGMSLGTYAPRSWLTAASLQAGGMAPGSPMPVEASEMRRTNPLSNEALQHPLVVGLILIGILAYPAVIAAQQYRETREPGREGPATAWGFALPVSTVLYMAAYASRTPAHRRPRYWQESILLYGAAGSWLLYPAGVMVDVWRLKLTSQ